MDKIIEEGDDSVIKTPDVGKHSIDIIIEELQKEPVDRLYVNRCLPRYKLDPAWIEPPCYYGDEGKRFDWNDVCNHYKFTIVENPQLGKTDLSVLEYRFDCYMRMKKKEYCDNIKALIKYDPAYEKQANIFLEKLYNIYKPSFVEVNGIQYYNGELFKDVVRHFIWSIKWKMNKGDTCLHNLFINFEGEQGCGKSMFAEHLGKKILGNYFCNSDIDVLGDQFGAAILEDKFLINFDELVKTNTPVEKIKQITTAEKTEYRKMMSEKYIERYIRASFMSTCNKPIYEIINDETGSRRFANFKFMNGCIKDEIELCSELDKLWDENVVALWKSVNENLPTGYIVGNDMSVLLDRARTTYNAKGDTVRRWLNYSNKCIVSINKSDSHKLETAYNDYKEYCAIEDQTPCSFDNFKTRIKNMYTGKVKLPPNKLAIMPISSATVDEVIDKTEVNPFSEYIEFKPYDIEKNSTYSTCSTHEANSYDILKKCDETKNLGGTSGISVISSDRCQNLSEIANSDGKKIPPTKNDGWNLGGINPIDSLIKDQKSKLQRWDNKIEYEEPPRKDEFIEDNENFFKKLEEMQNE